jgi:hypothetical protein
MHGKIRISIKSRQRNMSAQNSLSTDSSVRTEGEYTVLSRRFTAFTWRRIVVLAFHLRSRRDDQISAPAVLRGWTVTDLVFPAIDW